MGTARIRDRSMKNYSPGSYETGYYTSSGTVWNHVSSTSGSSLDNIYEYCEDVLGPGPPYVEPHNLYIAKRKVVPLRYNGEASLSVGNVRRHTDFTRDSFAGNQYATAPAVTDLNYWKAKALASINPFKPQANVPLFLFELRELPSMLRGLGHVLSGRIKPKDAPGGYLAYNFGWAPLLSDLGSLFNFAKSISNSRRALTNAANGGRVSHTLGSKSSTGLPTVYGYTLGAAGTYNILVTHTLTVKAWVTARVHLTEPLPLLESERQLQAIQTAFALNLNPATLWDAIPWTWLIDYFTNIGDLVEARNGYTRWRFKDMYVMVKTVYTHQASMALNSVGSMSFSGGTMTYTRKQRAYQGSNPNVGFGLSPMLTDFQAGILGALLTAGALRSAR